MVERLEKKKSFNFTTIHSRSSKLQSFLSFQRHYIRQDSTIFHMMAFWSLPNALSCKWKGLLYNLSQPYKAEDGIPLGTSHSQWSKMWSIGSPLFLHMHNQSTIMTCYFLRLFVVSIFPKRANQAKNTTLKGALFRHIVQGKGLLL